MRIVERNKGNWPLQFRRLLRYQAFALLPLLILCGIILSESHRWTRRVAEQNARDMFDKNYELIEQYFESLSESVSLMVSDPSLIHLLSGTTGREPLTVRAAQREFVNICPRYFYMPNQIESVYIIASDYSLCHYNMSGLPTSMPESAILIAPLIRASGSAPRWFPTHNLATTFGLSDRYASYYADRCRVFTLGFEMSMSYVRNEYTYIYPEKDHPLVMVNVHPEVFDQWLSAKQTISEARYAILDEQGGIVYASDGDQAALTADGIARGMITQSRYMRCADGRDRYVSTRSFARNGWTLLSEADTSSAYTGMNIGVISLIVILGTSLFTAAASLLTTQRVAKPLDMLSRALEETSRANFDYRITSPRHTEYYPAFEAYNSMNAHITKLIKENYEIQLNEKNLEIQLINMQFNPHFLYNTLNIISLMALSRDQFDISDTICQLSDMMRYSSKTPSMLVPLRDDLSYIESYIALMKLRFNQPFAYSRDIDEPVLRCLIPKFLLQPFIENAILHGFCEEDPGYALRLSGRIEGDDLVIVIADNGKGMPTTEVEALWRKDAEGIGVSNSNRRIQLYYGEGYGIGIRSREGDGTTVTIRIPRRPAPGAP